ncbi:hypothetical protein SCLCIDRAFT_1209095 [Scleroderma citrinum Foug A]|uniref:Uncharacterized protein n=1 Tax=Scleroderma citrinum Foug A TaxID=1036808 RepID=A0A0C3EKY9_9AGAM|nr:hypothetical protein SCLCIDRAFT_1209095 [Scleroderma citrinum Foug A]
MACHGTLLKVDVGGSVYAVLADTRVPQRTNPYEDSGLNPILQLVNFVLACHRPDASCSPSSIVMDQDMHAFGRGDPLLFIRKPDLRQVCCADFSVLSYLATRGRKPRRIHNDVISPG